MNYFKQTEEKFKAIKMGFGTGSIYDYGCYLVSFLNGLNEKGYNFTPESMNDMLKSANAWVGPTKNYIDVANLHKYFPNIFTSFQQIDPWYDIPDVSQLIKENLVIVGRVDARGIGGSGTHFVLITGQENGIAIIHDPWTGNVEKITKRYGNLGNILGIRIFTVKPYKQESDPNPQENIINKSTAITEVYEGIVKEKPNQDEMKKYLNRRLDELIREVCESDNRFYNAYVKKYVDQAIEQRDAQWVKHEQEALDKQKKDFDEKSKQALKDLEELRFKIEKEIKEKYDLELEGLLNEVSQEYDKKLENEITSILNQKDLEYKQEIEEIKAQKLKDLKKSDLILLLIKHIFK